MSNNRELADLISQAGGTSEGVLAGRRNLIINGAMQVWQRGTSFGNGLTADRWTVYSPSSTDIVTQQSNTLDTKYPSVAQWATSSTAGTRYFYQKIEDVRTLSNEEATLSFWAKVSTGSAVLTSVVGNQNFGSGGSAFVDGQTQNNTVTDTWQKFTHTGTFASIDGKTIGSSSYIEAAFNTTEINTTFQITGVQLEVGSVATPFEHRSYGEELALCQRYFEKVHISDFTAVVYTPNGDTRFTPIVLNNFRVAPSVTPSSFTNHSINFGASGSAINSPTVQWNVTVSNTDDSYYLYISQNGAYTGYTDSVVSVGAHCHTTFWLDAEL